MKYSIIYLLTLLSIVCTAQEVDMHPVDNSDVYLQTLIAKNKKLKSIQCDFEQKQEISVMEEILYSSGKLFIVNNDKLRWDYETPNVHSIIINGDKVKVDGIDQNKKGTSRLYKSISKLIMGSISGDLFKDEKTFTSSFYKTESCFIVKLTPNSDRISAIISEMHIYFSLTDYSVDQIIIGDSMGDKTRIQLTNKIFDQNLDQYF